MAYKRGDADEDDFETDDESSVVLKVVNEFQLVKPLTTDSLCLQSLQFLVRKKRVHLPETYRYVITVVTGSLHD